MSEATLRNRRILVVEDEYMLAEDMRAGLEHAGAVVLGPVPSVEEALELLAGEADLDGAVLDINLNGEKVFPVVDALAARGIPFLFATGYSGSDVPPAYRSVARCEKPVNAGTIARVLAAEADEA